ncbi:16S rRNA (guanine(966)-N(2))-methyltransferase RsmD [Buchnera aphidicola (Mollitrichosiphum nigrofasciatum)]|uniref:16S rRNA (guanine(966)-N(2))-methyltransferase RsmD n=1 Tax=Buchnera aphidicola TaxID=9 RepID=UPI0031B8658D
MNLFKYKKKELRPTTSLTKKILFSWLKPKIINASCLDCFAGSGALGINAAINYAKYVTLLEKNQHFFLQIKKKIKLLKLKNIEIIKTNTLNWLNKKGFVYDIIFLDPPFKKNILQKVIFLIEKNNWIRKDSIIYIEKSTYNKNIIIPKKWFLYKKKTYKNLSFYIYICK